ncbi:MAG: 2-C-methyl-D-erythritol 4-phosphate cytidylyltransferase [Chloroflexota bacterium]
MVVGAIVVGAGASRRAGFDKVFAPLAGRPVLAHSVETLTHCASVDRIVIVLAAANLARGEALVRGENWEKVTRVCKGGPRRQDSVAAGLSYLSDCEWVLIHDAARPLVTVDLVERGLRAATASGAAIAAIPVVDTIKVVGPDRAVLATPDRATLWAVQTPQIFHYELIATAYREALGDFTDDAGLLEQGGHRVRVYEGAADNLKITLPGDLRLAEFYLERRRWHE